MHLLYCLILESKEFYSLLAALDQLQDARIQMLDSMHFMVVMVYSSSHHINIMKRVSIGEEQVSVLHSQHTIYQHSLVYHTTSKLFINPASLRFPPQ